MNDALKRAIRTFVQAALGVVAVQGVALMADAEDGVLDVDLWRRVLLTAVIAGVIAAVSWAQNAVEDKTGRAIIPK